MSGGRWVSIVVVLAMTSPFAYVLREYVLHRRWMSREWTRLQAQVDALRADIDAAADFEQWAEEMA